MSPAFRLFLILAPLCLSSLGCNDQPPMSCAQGIFNGTADRSAITFAPYIGPGPDAIQTSDQPILHFDLQDPHHHSYLGPPPSIRASVTLVTSASDPARTVTIDVPGQSIPADELRIEWDPNLVQAYVLSSYETRTQPSSEPGVTLTITTYYASGAPSGLNLAKVSLWKNGDGHSSTEIGAETSISDDRFSMPRGGLVHSGGCL